MNRGPQYHKLSLSYSQYQKMGKDIGKNQLGKYIVDYAIKLGKGQYGTVYKAIDDQSKTEVAVKVIDLKAIKEEKSEKKREILERLSRNEDKMMLKCNSPYLVKCFDVFQNEDLKIIVMEYCNRGSLTQYLENKKTLPEDEAISILKQILKGVVELHSKKIVHRDLKTDNIMLHNSIVKIVDFGFSKALQIETDETLGKNTACGTQHTMAPEVLAKLQYGLKADIWSVGVIFYQLLFGQLPYISSDRIGLIDLIKQKDLFKEIKTKFGSVQICEETRDFLKATLKINQRERIGWREVLKHPLFSKVKETYISAIYDPDLDENPPIEENPEEPLSGSVLLPKPTNSMKLIKMFSKDIEKKRKEIKSSSSTIGFNYMFQKLHESNKVQWIFNELIQPISKEKIFDFDSRKVVEMMYLLLTRCFLDLSPIKNEINKKNIEDPKVKEFCGHINNLYQQINNRWKQNSDRMTQKENQVTSIIWDFFKSNEQLKREDRFNNGIENKDFTRAEHITYIQTNYIIPLLEDRSEVPKKVQKLMLAFQDIMMGRPEEIQKKGFEKFLEEKVNY